MDIASETRAVKDYDVRGADKFAWARKDNDILKAAL